LTEDDLAAARRSPHPWHQLHVLWGVKECIYKAYGKRKLGFRENIIITQLDHEHDRGKGEIDFEGIHLQYEFYYRLLPEVAWVFCLESDAPSF
jgi:phosphopantetheinyl transferase (holo-ACP synthase)